MSHTLTGGITMHPTTATSSTGRFVAPPRGTGFVDVPVATSARRHNAYGREGGQRLQTTTRGGPHCPNSSTTSSTAAAQGVVVFDVPSGSFVAAARTGAVAVAVATGTGSSRRSTTPRAVVSAAVSTANSAAKAAHAKLLELARVAAAVTESKKPTAEGGELYMAQRGQPVLMESARGRFEPTGRERGSERGTGGMMRPVVVCQQVPAHPAYLLPSGQVRVCLLNFCVVRDVCVCVCVGTQYGGQSGQGLALARRTPTSETLRRVGGGPSAFSSSSRRTARQEGGQGKRESGSSSSGFSRGWRRRRSGHIENSFGCRSSGRREEEEEKRGRRRRGRARARSEGEVEGRRDFIRGGGSVSRSRSRGRRSEEGSQRCAGKRRGGDVKTGAEKRGGSGRGAGTSTEEDGSRSRTRTRTRTRRGTGKRGRRRGSGRDAVIRELRAQVCVCFK